MNPSPDKVRVLHLITRLIVAGSQENTMLSAQLLDRNRFDAQVWAGPQTGDEGDYRDEFERRDIPVSTVPDMVRELHPLKDFRALRYLTERLRAERFDIVHTHCSKAGILGREAAVRAGVPVVVHTIHAWGFHDRMPGWMAAVYVALEKRAAKQTDALIAVNRCDTDKGLGRGIGTPDQYSTIHSGIELTPFQQTGVDRAAVRDDLGIPPESTLIGTIGRIAGQKDPMTFIEVARRVHETEPGTHFLWVGDGVMREAVHTRIRELGLGSAFTFTGVRRDIPQLTQAMDLFLLTSLWEGLPRVFPQCMASGVPIVATNVDGAPEAIEDGVNGFLLEPKDVDGLASAVLNLVRDPALRERMGNEGRRRVDPAFSAHDMAARISTLYEQLLNKKSVARGSRPRP